MTTDQPTSLRTAREHAIDVLCRHYASDELSMSELERRLEMARAATTRDELDALLSDLSAPAATPPAVATDEKPTRGRKSAPVGREGGPEPRRSSHAALAVMGGTRRAGKWAPPGNMIAIAIMGGVELDFRDAVLQPGVTDINCFAFWGGVEITVPPDVYVDTHGFALMGGFEQTADHATDPPPDAPVIRVNGFALMGGVEVKVRPRGETKRKPFWENRHRPDNRNR